MIAVNRNIKNILFTFLPLVVGTLMYALLRAEKPMFLSWMSGAEISTQHIAAVDWLPDYLWCFSLLVVLSIVWKGWKNIPLLWLISIWAAVTSTEFLQYYHILFGTFDWKDIIAYQFAFLTHIIINRKPLL